MQDNDFNSEVGSMSTDQLDQLFEGAVEGTPGADDLSIGSQHIADDPNLEPLDPNLDLFSDDTKTPEELEAQKLAKEKADAEAEAAKLEADKNKTPEEIEAAKKKAEEEKAADVPLPQVIEALTNTVDFLIKSGQWEDFEGRDKLEITPEVYQELVIAQDTHRLTTQFNELVDSTGDYGKAIIQHIKQGGNPDEVIDIFKEQKALETIDTSTEAGKIIKIEKYYKDILGWKDKKVESFVKDLVANEKIEEEFTDVNELYDKHYKQQLESLNEKTKEEERKTIKLQEEFKSNIKTALEKENTLTPKERKLIESAILDFKHDIGGGRKVNDFYLKFAEVQKDPAAYIDLVRFIMDREGYKKTIKIVEESAAAKKAFTFIKGNAAVSKATPASRNTDTGGKVQTGTNFSFTR